VPDPHDFVVLVEAEFETLYKVAVDGLGRDRSHG
jgi:hypothetical protein